MIRGFAAQNQALINQAIRSDQIVATMADQATKQGTLPPSAKERLLQKVAIAFVMFQVGETGFLPGADDHGA